MLKPSHFHKFMTGITFSVLVINLAFLAWYVFIGYQGHFHSDAAAKVLLAREIHDTGEFFPRDWNYLNGDLWILFGHLFIIPLLSFMPAGFTTHAISGAIFSVLILHGTWLVTGLASIPVWRRLAILAIVAAGLSALMAENLFGQVSYGRAVILCLYLLFLTWKYLSCRGWQRVIWGVMLAAVFLLTFWGNPTRATVVFALPLVAALSWVAFSCESKDLKHILAVTVFGALGALCGSALHAATITKVNNIPGAGDARWLSFDDAWQQLPLALKGLLAQLGGLPVADASLFASHGLYAGLRFSVALLTITLIPIAIMKALDSRSTGMKLIAVFGAVSLTLTFFLQVTTSIPDMNDPVQSSRYLVPGIFICVILLLMTPVTLARPPVWLLCVGVVGIVLISAAPTTYRVSAAASGWNPQPVQMSASREAIIEFLDGNGLEYGYATFWNAGVLSVLSNERTRIRQVQFREGLPEPMRWLSSNRWYRPSAWTGKSFLLLQEDELDLVAWDLLESIGLKPLERHSIDGYTIVIFQKNLARRLPGWDTRYEEATHFPIWERTLTQVGQMMSDGSRTMLVAEKGQSGALHYGPFVRMDPGRYRVSFDVLANYHPRGVALLDVGSWSGQAFGEMLIMGSHRPQALEISLPTRQIVQFRVLVSGSERVIFRGVTVERLPEEGKTR